MLNGVEKRKSPSNVKVGNFCGSTVRDIYNYVKLPSRKKPSDVFFHVRINDAINSDSSTIVNQYIGLKEYTESELLSSMITLSLRMMRPDNTKANKTLAAVKIAIKYRNSRPGAYSNDYGMSIDTINNNNIIRDHIGRVGLHINFHGNINFAANLLSKIKLT